MTQKSRMYFRWINDGRPITSKKYQKDRKSTNDSTRSSDSSPTTRLTASHRRASKLVIAQTHLSSHDTTLKSPPSSTDSLSFSRRRPVRTRRFSEHHTTISRHSRRQPHHVRNLIHFPGSIQDLLFGATGHLTVSMADLRLLMLNRVQED